MAEQIKTRLFKNDRSDGKGAPWGNSKVTINHPGEYKFSCYRNDDGSLYLSMILRDENEERAYRSKQREPARERSKDEDDGRAF